MYLFKIDKINTRKRCGICSKLTTKTQERSQWRSFGAFIVKFDYISHLFLLLLLLSLKKLMLAGELLLKLHHKGPRGILKTLPNINHGVLFVKYFYQKVPSQIFDRALNIPLNSLLLCSSATMTSWNMDKLWIFQV